MIFFGYSNDFSYFPLRIISQSCWTWSERSKMTILKGGVDGFSYFSLISVILFSNQDHPCFNTGFCLIQVILQAGLTVQRKSGKIK
jgi:hypothetical protein